MALYDWAQFFNVAREGTIGLALAIAPDGTVKSAEVVKSSFANPALETAVLKIVRIIDFGRANGEGYFVCYFQLGFNSSDNAVPKSRFQGALPRRWSIPEPRR